VNTLLVAARSVHFASAILLFGSLVFVIAVAGPVWHDRPQASSAETSGVEQRIFLIAFWSAIAGAGSSVAWLGVEAAAIMGLPLGEAIRIDKLTLILGNTVFGRVWCVRVGLVIAVWGLLLAIGRSANARRRSRLALAATAAAAMYLCGLAWVGHAAAGEGLDRAVQIVSDVVHLLAAGAWLGALPGLVQLLGGARLQDAENLTHRFSRLGVAGVGALILTGSVNAWFLEGDVPALFGTAYGRLLLAKLALFVAMIGLAATNRWYLTPRLATGNGDAVHNLRRNAVLETGAGILVVVIVGALGASVPAAHDVPVWPFDYTLSCESADESPAIRAALFAAGLVAWVRALRLRGSATIDGFVPSPGSPALCLVSDWGDGSLRSLPIRRATWVRPCRTASPRSSREAARTLSTAAPATVATDGATAPLPPRYRPSQSTLPNMHRITATVISSGGSLMGSPAPRCRHFRQRSPTWRSGTWFSSCVFKGTLWTR
jgi:putative copper resistance protein D